MPERYKDRIMRLVKRSDYQPLKERQLARLLHVPDDDYAAFRTAVKQLLDEKRLVVGDKHCLTLPPMGKRVTGTFQLNSRGFGFVRPETTTAQGDLFIPPGSTGDAVTGDVVAARVREAGQRDGQQRFVGVIEKVLERGETQFVGKLTRDGQHWFVQPDGNQITSLISVDDPGAKDCKAGDKVLVEIASYPSGGNYASGVILERLGKAGTGSAELKGVIARYHLSDKFERKVRNAARAATRRFEQTDLLDGREDIRKQVIITIDPNDARDFDDAISLERLAGGGWRLGVHIADVSHFVTEDSPLDEEARRRATSVYLPQHVIPMLPELLSNGVCSLQEGQDRFVKSAYITLDENGAVRKTRFANSVMRSTQRLTYEQADAILSGAAEGVAPEVVWLLKEMEMCARVLEQRRMRDGMLRLDMPEAELVYDEQGRVIDAHPADDSYPHTIIEMFMLEANEAAARLLDSLNVPFLRRIHAPPDALAADETARVVKLCGYTLPKRMDRKALQSLLLSVVGKPQSFVINLAVLKSLQRAEYSPAPIEHFALASKHYCHFTSPIRRYPDLTVHRLLQAYINGKLTKHTTDDFPDFGELEELGARCSDQERNAEKAEDDLREFKLLQMLTNRTGETTKAVVTSIVNFGLFVQLEKFLIEGLIRAEDVPRDGGKAGKGKGKSKGKRQAAPRGKFTETCPYKLGQEIEVRIADVNVPGRMLDLVPA